MVADLMSAFVMVMRAHPKDADVAEAGANGPESLLQGSFCSPDCSPNSKSYA
jgi:hypothetical protein